MKEYMWRWETKENLEEDFMLVLYIVVNLHVLLDHIVTLKKINFAYWIRAIMVNLQLPMQSVPITTDVGSNLDQGEVYSIMR
jgi:hypothetical protein